MALEVGKAGVLSGKSAGKTESRRRVSSPLSSILLEPYHNSGCSNDASSVGVSGNQEWRLILELKKSQYPPFLSNERVRGAFFLLAVAEISYPRIQKAK